MAALSIDAGLATMLPSIVPPDVPSEYWSELLTFERSADLRPQEEAHRAFLNSRGNPERVDYVA
ncbi:MAG: hypothetical protein DMG57_08255 [Acidobacteria bacterium]|nr:MAG: hypothetical protein DMG57_08255 [Acidobacteriota bacterium]